MGWLVDGRWVPDDYEAPDTGGRYVPVRSGFREAVTADGAGAFPAAPGRYHLFVAHACPWAHRTAIYRRLKGLEDVVTLSIVAPRIGEEGWVFGETDQPAVEPVAGVTHLRDLYTASRADYTGRVSVPVLWDKREGQIVNNESSEIIRMLNSAFDGAGAERPDLDLYPEPLRDEIDAINATVFEHVNSGVYKCGFATSQAAYEEAFDALFETLDELEARLGQRRYLVGEAPTEADWRLFPTLARFDTAYYGTFKCNKRRLVEYPNLWSYTRELYQMPGIAETVNLDHIKRSYYGILGVNPTGIIPKGPEIDFTAPPDRAL